MIQGRPNPQQLVIRLDTATGLARVGWAVDLPLGRFSHLELICENDNCSALNSKDPLYPQYLLACEKSAALNKKLLDRQAETNLANGWMRVSGTINGIYRPIEADVVGSYCSNAMALLYELTRNYVFVWIVASDTTTISYIESKQPPRDMDDFEYQVWRQHTLNRLSEKGRIHEGKLMIQDSGLWFVPDNSD